MAIEVSRVGEVSVISVHDEQEPIHFSLPAVVPSRYDIPGVSAPREVFSRCRMSINPGRPPIQYALHRTLNHKPYVIIKLIEPNTFIYGTEKQTYDEYGQKLQPDVMRVPVPVHVEAVANEMERTYGIMGLRAHKGDVTPELIDDLENIYVNFLRSRVQQTTIWAQKNPNNVTAQARRSAFLLHKRGLLNPMPAWALLDPDAEGLGKTTFNCKNCGSLLNNGAATCSKCGAIYNRQLAYELGFLKMPDLRPGELEAWGIASAIPSIPQQIEQDDTVPDADVSPAGQPEPPEGFATMEDLGTGLENTASAELHARARKM